MQAQTFKTWMARRIAVPTRLQQVCVHYLLFLMVATRKHSFTEAARFSGLHNSVFCNSSTSGKAGGLRDSEPLKAVRLLSRLKAAFGYQSSI